MCEKCKELDECIAHYRKVASAVSDEQTLKSISILVRSFEAEKRFRHADETRQTAGPDFPRN
jgi:hypothetical protein